MKVSPLAKRLANERGIDLSRCRDPANTAALSKRDIDWFKPGPFVASGAAAAVGALTQESFEEIAVSQMRKTIVRRLGESKFTAAFLSHDFPSTWMPRSPHASINAVTSSKVSFNDFVIKAAAAFAPQSQFFLAGRYHRINHHVNIGVAVAVEEGLLVPVVRFADSKTLHQINTEVKAYAQRARRRNSPRLGRKHLYHLNLGMFGIEEFTAIINPRMPASWRWVVSARCRLSRTDGRSGQCHEGHSQL